jgi:ParB-like chromosome segregation protein Spo0J
MTNYDQHPLSSAFPSMSQEAFKELVDDIDLNGVRERIVVYQGKILDGWHRYMACKELNVSKPPLQEFEGEDPVAFVLSKNLHRRHLPAGIRAMIIAKLTDWQEGAGRPSKSLANAKEMGNFTQFISSEQSANLAGVSRKTMTVARQATKAIEPVQQAVSDGKISIAEAASLSHLPAEEQMAAIAEPKPKSKSTASTPKTVPMEVYQALQKQYDDLVDHCENLTAELKRAQLELNAVESVRNNDQVKALMELHDQIKLLNSLNDQKIQKNAELQKQINYLNKKLGK